MHVFVLVISTPGEGQRSLTGLIIEMVRRAPVPNKGLVQVRFIVVNSIKWISIEP